MSLCVVRLGAPQHFIRHADRSHLDVASNNEKKKKKSSTVQLIRLFLLPTIPSHTSFEHSQYTKKKFQRRVLCSSYHSLLAHISTILKCEVIKYIPSSPIVTTLLINYNTIAIYTDKTCNYLVSFVDLRRSKLVTFITLTI